MGWANYYKIKCKECGKLRKSKYKDLCNYCYRKNWKETYKSINMGRINCPNCNSRGRISVSYSCAVATGNISFHSLRIQHWKWESGKKKYSHMCSIDRRSVLKILDKIKDEAFNKARKAFNEGRK